MKPKPVRRVRRPGYPTKLETLADPELLDRHRPPAFRPGRELAGAATFFLAAGLAACGGDPPSTGGAGVAGPSGEAKGVAPPAGAVVAPLFAHGEGRGVTGCVVHTPPVFLSEAEALQIVTEELGRYGLSFPERNRTIDAVRLPSRTERWEFVPKAGGPSKQRAPDGTWTEGEFVTRIDEKPGKKFSLDARDPAHQVGFEYVSVGDARDLGGPQSMSTVSEYDLPAVARELGEKMAESGGPELRFGVLYDPFVPLEPAEGESWQDAENRLREESRKLLRQQVSDFIDWLKAQGVI